MSGLSPEPWPLTWIDLLSLLALVLVLGSSTYGGT